MSVPEASLPLAARIAGGGHAAGKGDVGADKGTKGEVVDCNIAAHAGSRQDSAHQGVDTSHNKGGKGAHVSADNAAAKCGRSEPRYP